MQVKKVTLWTDSTIVLSLINSDAGRWNIFVANRISEIQELTSSADWRHVISEENPSDLISRGVNPITIINSTLWWHGPRWLELNEARWPNDISYQTQINLLPDFKKSVALPAINRSKQNYLYTYFETFSSFSRLQRTFAYVLRFISNSKQAKERRQIGSLIFQELQAALHLIIWVIQREDVPNETTQLQHSRNSQLTNLDPFIDNNCLLRVGGRVRLAKVPYSQRHPLILPKKNHVSRLLIKYEHIRLCHAGPQLTLFNLRLKFWIIDARNEIRNVIHKCIICLKQNAITQSQMMADLPSVRVTLTRPFLHCGVDYAGPINIKQSRIRRSLVTKEYICLFICMVTKAIHIELVSDMTTKTFMNALNRFISRRGCCSKIYSDNSSNFKGAKQELSKIYKMFNTHASKDEIYKYMAEKGIKWNFIPPASPHWGGIWESGIKMVKHHLYRMMQNLTLTYEELNTLCTQVEALVNSRPLCQLSDSDVYDVLTPSHFLIGEPLTLIPDIYDTNTVPVNRLAAWNQISRAKAWFWKRWSNEYLSVTKKKKMGF